MDNDSTTARIAIKSLSDELQVAPTATVRPGKILPHLERIQGLCSDTKAPITTIHRELLYHRAISVVVKCLGRLCTDNLQFVTVARQKCVITSLSILARSLRRRERVCEVLDSGFLPIFIRSTRRLDDKCVVEVCTTFATVFSQHLVYRSVLRSFAQALKMDVDPLVKASGIERRYPKWLVFMAEVERMLGYKKKFDQDKKNHEDPGVKACANQGVFVSSCFNKQPAQKFCISVCDTQTH